LKIIVDLCIRTVFVLFYFASIDIIEMKSHRGYFQNTVNKLIIPFLRIGFKWPIFLFLSLVLKNSVSAQKLDFFYQSKQGQFPNQRIFGADIKKNNNAVILYSTGELSTELVGENYSKTIDEKVTVLLEITPNGDIARETQIELKRESGGAIGSLLLGLDENENMYITFYLDGELKVYINGALQTTMTPKSDLTYIKGFGVIKLDKDGNFIKDWVIDLNESFYGFFDFAVGPTGVYVLYSTIESETLSSDGKRVFNLNQHVERFSQNGVLLDELSFTGLLSNRTSNTDDRFVIGNLGVNSSGEVFLTGRITNNAKSTLSTDFPLAASTSAARSGVVLVKLSNTLDYEWKRTFTGGAFNYISSPSISPDDGVVLSYSIQDDLGDNSPQIRLHELGIEIAVEERLSEVPRRSFQSIVKISNKGGFIWSTVSKGLNTGEIFQNLKGEIYVLNQEYFNFQGADSKGNYFLRENPKRVGQNNRNFVLKISEDGLFLNTSFFTKKVKDSGQYIETEYSYILPLNSDCEEFYLAASFNGKFDINPDINSESLIESTSTRDLFFAKFGNSAPTVAIDNLDASVCSFGIASINFTLVDENPQVISFTVNSSDSNIIPSDSVKFSVSGNNVNMEIGIGELSGEVVLEVIATDNCDYEDSFKFTLNIESGLRKPIINSGQMLYVLCEGESIELMTGESGNLWSNGSRDDSILIKESGEFWVKRISENGCESINSDTVTVEFVPQPLRPVITVSGSVNLCQGERVTLSSSLTENIIWSTGETSQTIEVERAGVYTVLQQSETCGNGESSESVEVVVNPIPEQPIIDSGFRKPVINNGRERFVLCEGESIKLMTGESGNLWSNGSRDDSILIKESGEFWVKRVSENGCESINSDTVTIEFVSRPIKPEVTVSRSINLCKGETVTLTSSLTENIIWSTGETSQTIEVERSGVYTVLQPSQICGNGESSEPVEVVVNPIPEQPIINVNGESQFCEGGSVVLTTTETGNIFWSNGETDESIEIKESGEYTLFVERNGCVSQVSAPINIKVDEDFTFSVVSDTVVCEGLEQLEIKPEFEGVRANYLWSDGSDLSSLIIDKAGAYWLEVSNGTCEKPRVYIEVSEACYPKIIIPTAFSPNGDGVNDTFEIMGSRIFTFEIGIFNRWGNQVFYTKNLKDFWDGTYSGQPAPLGSYSYKVIYAGEINGQVLQFTQKGTVAVIR
jgi:gliding motility-associated-like protein